MMPSTAWAPGIFSRHPPHCPLSTTDCTSTPFHIQSSYQIVDGVCFKLAVSKLALPSPSGQPPVQLCTRTPLTRQAMPFASIFAHHTTTRFQPPNEIRNLTPAAPIPSPDQRQRDRPRSIGKIGLCLLLLRGGMFRTPVADVRIPRLSG